MVRQIRDANTLLDKAIQALGGERRLQQVTGFSWKGKGPITTNGLKGEMSIVASAQGLDRFRQEFEMELGGTKFKGMTVLEGNQGFREFLGKRTPLDATTLAEEKRSAYFTLLPLNPLLLKDKAFKLEVLPEASLDNQPVHCLKVSPREGKPFTLFFDKTSGLLVKLVGTMPGPSDTETLQELIFRDYKAFDGIQKATRVESRRNGQPFLTQVLSEFSVQDKKAGPTRR